MRFSLAYAYAAVLTLGLSACGVDQTGVGIGDAGADAIDDAMDGMDGPLTPELTVDIINLGSASGAVSSDPAAIVCPDEMCAATFPSGTAVTLRATPGPDSVFLGWTGACNNSELECAVTLTESLRIEATFAPAVTVTVLRDGSGVGNVMSTPEGIDCGADCSGVFQQNAVLELVATAAPGSRFVQWSESACGSDLTCSLMPSADLDVTATFIRTYPLEVLVVGGGSVTSEPVGIDCGATCTGDFDEDSVVTLTAAPDAGEGFTGWSGVPGCDTDAECVVTMDMAQTAQATFTGLSTLTVDVMGEAGGSGIVNIAPPGTDCTGTCAEDFLPGTTVTLTASPAMGSRFVGWSELSCGSAPTCVVNLVANATVTASFVGESVLTVMRTGSGTGTITSSPVGIDCGASCMAAFDRNSTVSLTAVGAPGSIFRSWSGCTSESGNVCSIDLTSDTTVTAEFVAQHTVSVVREGMGTVSGGAINCGSTCSAVLDEGGSIALNAAPASGWRFDGWLGCPSALGNVCEIVGITNDVSITAVFAEEHTVRASTVGSGSVTSSPSGINCGSDCSDLFDDGSRVELTAMPASGSDFVRWESCPSESGNLCVIEPLTSDVTVTAVFAERPTVTVNNSGGGTVTSAPSGINCGGTCASEFSSGDTIVLTASASSGFAFDGWTGCPSVGPANVCTLSSVTADTTVGANFVQLFDVDMNVTGSGTISSSTGTSCTSSCGDTLPSGSNITITATPATGYVFDSWTGCPSPAGTSCVISGLSADQNVTAVFVADEYTLTVNRAGPSGAGSVTSSPSGISCGSTCVGTFGAGSTVTLTAAAASGFVLSGWSGCTSASGPSCVVNLTSDRSVTATFAASHELSVSIAGAGDGTVTSSPGGINCGSDCSETYLAGTSVSLSVSPGVRSSFTGWGGACSGTGACVVMMNSTQNVVANFDFFPAVYLSQTNKDPQVRLRWDALAADLDAAAGAARSDTGISAGSGVYYVEGHRLTGSSGYGMQIAASSASVNNVGCGSSANTVGFTTNGGVTDQGTYVATFDELGDRYGFVVDYRSANPTVYVITISAPWIPGMDHVVIHETTLPTTEDLFVDVCGLRAAVLSELEVNFGNDTTNFPFSLNPAAVLTAAGHASVAADLVLGWGGTYAGPADTPPTITVPSSTVTVTLGSTVNLSASASDPEDGAITNLEWEVLTSPYYTGRVSGTGTTFSFVPPDIGRHLVAVRAVDSVMQETVQLVEVVVPGPITQQTNVVLTPDATGGNNIAVRSDGLAVRFSDNGKYGIRANQGIEAGEFWYFESSYTGSPHNMGVGVITREGTLDPYGGVNTNPWDDIGPSMSVNVLGPGTWHNLVPRNTSYAHATTYGFAVDYRAAVPVVYVIAGGAVVDEVTLDETTIPLYPMLYGNPRGTAPGTWDMTINFGDGSGASAFVNNAATALSAAGVSTTGLELGWGDVNQP